MLKSYTNKNYLKTFDIINKYNLKTVSSVFCIDKINLEIFLKKDNSDLNFIYKVYFYLLIIFGTLSFVEYKIIPGTTRTTNFSLKLTGVITNKSKIENFIDQFILEKKNMLIFKMVTQKVLLKNHNIILSLAFSLKDYIELNTFKVPKISYLNLEHEVLIIKFKLSKYFAEDILSSENLLKQTQYFSFWKILIRKK